VVSSSNKFVAARNGTVYVVSSAPIQGVDPNDVVVEIPVEHTHRSAAELITHFKVVGTELRLKQRAVAASQMKLALVGNWKMQCGIATYNEALWPELVKHVGDFRLFVEKNDQPTGPLNVIGDVCVAPEKVVACWKRGEPLGDLVKAIKTFDPDVVHIQHEFGLWYNAGYWLSLMSQLSEYRVFVTLHSVFHHRDKTIIEASIPNVIVHLDGARDVLKNEKQVPGNVFVVPHGCAQVTDKERLWNFYRSDHTLVMWGFGFPYKGFERAIDTVDILRRRYTDVFFTALFSESPFSVVAHQTYYNQLMKQLDQLDLHNNVAIIRGYQSDVSLDAYLRTNKVALFPYVDNKGHEVFGASGAARYAMTKLLPIVTTSVNHFSDLPTLKGDTTTQLADAVDRMFSNPVAYKDQVEKQCIFMVDNSWARVAEKHIKLFEKQ
jgi:glycosyltransferase involved in cell wall biosynthesis